MAYMKKYQDFVKSPYLIYSLTYQLIDIVLGYSNYIKKNIDIEANKKHWQKGSSQKKKIPPVTISVEGFINQDEDKNYYCQEYLLSWKHITNMNYKLGDNIRICEEYDNTDKRTMNKYPKRAGKFYKI